MRELDLETLEYLYENVRNYSDKQWIGFLISKKYSDASKCRCGLRPQDKCQRRTLVLGKCVLPLLHLSGSMHTSLI